MKALMWLFAGLIMTFGCVAEEAAKSTSFPDGTISFAAESTGGGKACSLPLVTGEHDFKDDDFNCTNDEMSYFKFNQAPSTTEVMLQSERCDGEKHKWFFDIKVYIHNLDTPWIFIGDLAAANPGDIVKRGIILLKKKVDTEEPYQGKLSCVTIARSPLP